VKTALVLFDLDGTLIDSVPDIAGALNRTLATIGRRPLSTKEAAGLLGQGAPLFVKSALQLTGGVLADDEVTDLSKQFLDDYMQNPVVDTVVYPGAIDALDKLRVSAVRLAACTNKPSSLVPTVMQQLGLSEYFPTVVCGDEVTNRKPHPDHIFDTIRRVAPNEETAAIMVGDNVNDFLAANSAEIASIAVSFGYAKCAPEELGATTVINHFNELFPAVEKILSAQC